MNFLRNTLLRRSGAYVSLLAVFVFTTEFLFVENRLQKVEETEAKLNYTYSVQLSNERLSVLVQQFLSGKTEAGPGIISELREQERRLRILGSGGYAEEQAVTLSPLSRLPAITYGGLWENWEAYRQSVLQVVNGAGEVPAPVTNDSIAGNERAIAVLASSGTRTAQLQYEGLSLSMSNWYDRLAEDLREETERRKTTAGIAKWTLLAIDFLLIGGIYYLFTAFVLKPLGTLNENIAHLQKTHDMPPNEIGKVAVTVNDTIENLRDATDFVTAIGEGNLSINYKESLDPEYTEGKNKLADSLIEMQRKLKSLNEEEEKRKWANEGIARFVGILRSSNDNLSVLGDKVIASLVQYTKSNQGGLYLLNDDNQNQRYLELVSLFAFDAKKFEQQKIRPGEGILGQTFLERETTYITAVPDEYIRISSGLGGARPKSLLIVPLKADEKVYGLVELASFNEFAPHEIVFVEKLGETIASTLASVKAAQKNKQLITEFEYQTEQMRAQEEEMRQNMEELQATQEEISRKERKYLERIAELEAKAAGAADAKKVDQLEHDFRLREQEYLGRIEALEKELESTAGKQQEEWLRVSELEKTLRINIEALKIGSAVEGKKQDGGRL